MVRQRLILTFIALGVVVFFLTQMGKKMKAIDQSSPEYSTQSDSLQTPSHKESEIVQKTDHSSSTNSQAMTSRKEVPQSYIRGTSSVNLNAENTQHEKSSFFEGTPWEIWVGVRAYSKKNGRPQAKVIGEVNGFYLVEESAQNIDVRNFSSSHPLVVIDSRLNVAGVVTGVFSVTLKEGVSPEIVTQASGIKILDSFPGIRTYFITSASDPFDLQAFQDSLKSEIDIENVHAEILSRQYEKN